MSHCTICNSQYFGKVAQGTTNRTMMRRHTEHINGQRQLWKMLLTLGFIHENTGEILLNAQEKAKIIKVTRIGINKKSHQNIKYKKSIGY